MPVEPGSQSVTFVKPYLVQEDTQKCIHRPTYLCRGRDGCSWTLNRGGRSQCQAGGGLKGIGRLTGARCGDRCAGGRAGAQRG